jgi:transcription-repair coupling factor (superfamily II helicase)
MRGSIIDIYPLTTEYPVRVELFDVEIDSLRYIHQVYQPLFDVHIPSILNAALSSLNQPHCQFPSVIVSCSGRAIRC